MKLSSSRPGSAGAADVTTAAIRRTASSISAAVVVAPRLKRTDDRRRSSGTRMAIKVGEGRVEPLAHAEPSEAAMQRAFQTALAGEVRAALDFVAATGGDEALARVRAARTDAFDIRGFTKLACRPSPRAGGHVCGFAVRIAVVTGEIDRTLTGRFYPGPGGLEFVEDAPPPTGA